METVNNQSTGKIGEKAALEYLQKKSYKILATNFRFSRLGEIDIIAADGEYICFIEVKTRSSTLFGMPSEAVNRRKQNNIVKIAQVYLKQHNLSECCVRFDIVEIMVKKTCGHAEVEGINLIKDAF
jgi:putative endonuclease